MLVGRVDEDGLSALSAAQDEDVVVHGAHHEAVDLGLGVLEALGALGVHLDRLV